MHYFGIKNKDTDKTAFKLVVSEENSGNMIRMGDGALSFKRNILHIKLGY